MIRLIAAVAFLMAGVGMVSARKGDEAELLSFFKGLYWRTPDDCPERMMVDRIAARGWHAKEVGILKGELQGNAEQVKAAREELGDLRRQILLGQQWPLREREQCVIPAGGKDRRSGRIDWSRALVFRHEFELNSTVAQSTGATCFLMWDRKYLYVRVDATDSHIKSVDFDRERRQGPWDGDCIEIFVMPSMRLKSYCEIVINPAGMVFSRIHCNNRNGWFVVLAEGPVVKPEVKITDRGYRIETAVPFAGLPNYMLGNHPETGQSLYFSVIRINDGRKYSFRPLLYDGHNIFGYTKAILGNIN